MVLPLSIVKQDLDGEDDITLTPPSLHYGVLVYVTTTAGVITDSYTEVDLAHDSQNRITSAHITNNSSNDLVCYMICMGDVV